MVRVYICKGLNPGPSLMIGVFFIALLVTIQLPSPGCHHLLQDKHLLNTYYVPGYCTHSQDYGDKRANNLM